MAINLADKADMQAAIPGINPGRRVELIEVANACRNVPYEPALTFFQGLQSCWLIHMAMNLEDIGDGVSFGRLDQILYSLYNQDMNESRMTKGRAVKILAAFGLKTCEIMPTYSLNNEQFRNGYAVAQAITLGGIDNSGNDCTNELSGLFIDACVQMHTREPALFVRVHKKTPSWFMDKALLALQLGCGRPSFYGDTAVIRALENGGVTGVDARDYAVIGSGGLAAQGCTYNSSNAAFLNLPVCLELALNEGKCIMGTAAFWNREGIKTPPVQEMNSFDDVLESFRCQVQNAMDEIVCRIKWLEEAYRIIRPTPVNSILTESCMDKALDVTWGGGMYDLTSIQGVGLADVGDSLYAIKKIVYDDKRYTLEELVRILKKDFRGNEDLRMELFELPGYGSGNSKADQMTQIAADIFTDKIQSRLNSREGRFIPGFSSLTAHHYFGSKTGALPYGRHAGQRLAAGISPVYGKDVSGPAAVLSSIVGLDSGKWINSCSVKLKFEKEGVAGNSGREKMSELIKSYFEKGGMQLQLNILDGEMLGQARDNHFAFPDIIVNVEGYCSYFNDLSSSVKNELIDSTSHKIDTTSNII